MAQGCPSRRHQYRLYSLANICHLVILLGRTISLSVLLGIEYTEGLLPLATLYFYVCVFYLYVKMYVVQYILSPLFQFSNTSMTLLMSPFPRNSSLMTSDLRHRPYLELHGLIPWCLCPLGINKIKSFLQLDVPPQAHKLFSPSGSDKAFAAFLP